MFNTICPTTIQEHNLYYLKKFFLLLYRLLIFYFAGAVGSRVVSVCPFCYKEFSTKSNLKIHMRDRHSGEGPWRCSLCSKLVKNKSSLRVHFYQQHRKPKNDANPQTDLKIIWYFMMNRKFLRYSFIISDLPFYVLHTFNHVDVLLTENLLYISLLLLLFMSIVELFVLWQYDFKAT